MTHPEVAALRESYTKAGQGHLFSFFETLTADQQQALLDQLRPLDVDHLNRIFERATAPVGHAGSVEPLPSDCVASTLDASKAQQDAWQEQGLRLIAQNEVAVILMAGGQGTRLGSSAPKGCYDIQLPSHKSLFQLQAERIRRLQSLARPYRQQPGDVLITWYVMTSAPTRAATEAHFEEHAYFGLDKRNVIFFNQGTLPCFSTDGKILLESAYQLTSAPDGNGGIYPALRNEGILKSLRERNISHVHSYCVDNCLVRVADPAFIGYCAERKADCGVKVVRKVDPDEPVGIVCRRGGAFSVVEYSEIDKELSARRRDDGQLAFGAANIANHYYSVDFLERVSAPEAQLTHHVASKKIKHINTETGELVVPAKPNGIKLEQFVFDVFPLAQNMAVFEVDRAEEFSPLKNAPGTGVDCPETSRRDIVAQHVRFVTAAGGRVVPGAGETAEQMTFEISPLVSYAGEGLAPVQGKTITTPCHRHAHDNDHRLVGATYNCDALVSLPWLAMDSMPRALWVRFGLNWSAKLRFHIDSPPRPVPVGSPPWIYMHTRTYTHPVRVHAAMGHAHDHSYHKVLD
ncbi:nucleotide-diphospho-sugar transferase [Syncephalis pseudoplumigaleata]|uniref:UDP-N-acetylglucosamine diphosphorylase n=1 Tax=Syncephalis pseudoplumigaleata TaxID=1712513 RepID=A0A4V1J1E1_9FUNG|nr:nucleotide-diphospho-sugar transferase [Syncephalis pseudoplumigaleata]|eukprot:RKP24739.1 nucleotide-diphospho-sugar transferase [Syncephalis pseudoplumigaleata]